MSQLSSKVAEQRLPPDQAITTFAEVLQGYDRQGAVAEAQRGAGLSYARGTQACPYGVDLDGVVQALAGGDFDGAASVVRASHPWAGILGRCCHRFCEAAMARDYPRGFEPLNLRGLERAAGDYGAYQPLVVEAEPSGKRVAVVGAGSGGLAIALGLLRHGHRVQLIDRSPELGGMLMTGYPNFRMPREVVRKETPILTSLLGLQLGHRLDSRGFQQLFQDYDAVCLATGFPMSAPVSLAGDDLNGVYDGVDLLERVSHGQSPEIGKHVAVLGAGYTAQDAARTSRRLRAREVTVVYRRGPEHMPIRQAVRQALVHMMEEEGITYRYYLNPLRLLGEEGRVTTVECQPMQLGEPDESGRASVQPANEPPIRLPVDTVIKCFGQVAELSILPDDVLLSDGLVLNRNGHSSRKGLFVTGDIAGDLGNDGAFASGLQLAEQVHRFLALADYAWPDIQPGERIARQRPGAALGGG